VKLQRSVVIDSFPDSAARYRDDHAIVAVDVIRATTTAVTAVALGHRCFPVATIEDAVAAVDRLEGALLVGELGGEMPFGFDLNNSPAALTELHDHERPIVLLSTSGTQLLSEAARGEGAVYAGCLRNHVAQAERAAGHARVAVLGAGSRNEFREEDQLCCAWIAEVLLREGYAAETPQTIELVERWRGASVEAVGDGRSAEYLRRSGQLGDLEFVLAHVADLDATYRLVDGELVEERA
jgi:2-phosphosulfolactate phosphatase